MLLPACPRASFLFFVGGTLLLHTTDGNTAAAAAAVPAVATPNHARSQYSYLTEGYEEARSLWPATPQAVGPYAARPKTGDATFDLLLNKIQVCSV